MLQVIMTIFILLLLPLATGHVLAGALGLYPERNVSGLAFRYLMGYVLPWAIFEAFGPLMIRAMTTLDALILAWGITYVVILILCFMIARKRMGSGSFSAQGRLAGENVQRIPGNRKKGIRQIWASMNRTEQVTTVLLIVLVLAMLGWQIWRSVRYTYQNLDDPTFLTPALDALDTNTMFRVDSDTGHMLDTIKGTGRRRDTIAPFQLYIATLSKMTGVHATILAHTVLSPFLILAGYAAYWCTADVLFEEDYRAKMLFLLFAGEILTFMGGATRAQGVAALIRTWHGKSIVASVMIPAIFSVLLLYGKEKEKRKALSVILFLMSGASCLLSTTGVAIIPALIGSFGLWYLISERNIRVILPLLFTVLPSVASAALYFLYG